VSLAPSRQFFSSRIDFGKITCTFVETTVVEVLTPDIAK